MKQSKKFSAVMTIILFFAFSCSVSLPQHQSVVIKKIITDAGPEDFVLDTFNHYRRLIISCSDRRNKPANKGGFQQYDLASGKVTHLIRVNEPKDFVCYPHGIDIIQNRKGELILLAVNHDYKQDNKTKHSVVQYRLSNDSIYFIKQYLHESIISPNDVCALPNESFYVTNDGKKTKGLGLLIEKIFQTKSSTIIYKDSLNNFHLATKNLPYANGIAVKNNQVYISCTFKSVLNIYNRKPDGTLTLHQKLKGVKGMDNITFYENDLIIPSHPSFTSFMKHVKNSSKYSPGIITRFNVSDNTSKPLFTTTGKEISANSTALMIADTLYVSQVFDNFLLQVIPDLPIK